MASHGTVSILSPPSLLPVSNYQFENDFAPSYDTVSILTPPPLILVGDGSYTIAGTQSCPPPPAPPTRGQLWPRGDWM